MTTGSTARAIEMGTAAAAKAASSRLLGHRRGGMPDRIPCRAALTPTHRDHYSADPIHNASASTEATPDQDMHLLTATPNPSTTPQSSTRTAPASAETKGAEAESAAIVVAAGVLCLVVVGLPPGLEKLWKRA